jgi:hypothetical protein
MLAIPKYLLFAMDRASSEYCLQIAYTSKRDAIMMGWVKEQLTGSYVLA